jgi:holo-[acyl-carrier protein] synthase
VIVGVGVDIIEINRIAEAMERNQNFLSKVFTLKERQYMEGKKNMAQHAAGMFAAKEAVAKALGTGVRGFSMADIEIVRDEMGKPSVLLQAAAAELASKFGDYSIHLSISHSKDNAIAYVIIEVLK